jgi:hypothetical protein
LKTIAQNISKLKESEAPKEEVRKERRKNKKKKK